jgi:hypothetical protein
MGREFPIVDSLDIDLLDPHIDGGVYTRSHTWCFTIDKNFQLYREYEQLSCVPIEF